MERNQKPYSEKFKKDTVGHSLTFEKTVGSNILKNYQEDRR